MAKPREMLTQTIKPKMDVAKKVETLGEGDIYLQSLGGMSFYGKKNETMLSGRLGKRISWNEKTYAPRGAVWQGSA